MRVLTSGDDRAAALIANMIYVHRTDLDNRWWRLLYLALLWSGLTILKPRTGSEDGSAQRRWLRRTRWLLTRGVSGHAAPSTHFVCSKWPNVSRSTRATNGKKNIAVEAANLRAIDRVACPVR
jgi:hypothetical protein